MMNADEDALRTARPRAAERIDKLQHAGHVVFVRRKTTRRQTEAGFRIDFNCRVMTVWELWAGFRSELEDAKPPPLGEQVICPQIPTGRRQ